MKTPSQEHRAVSALLARLGGEPPCELRLQIQPLLGGLEASSILQCSNGGQAAAPELAIALSSGPAEIIVLLAGIRLPQVGKPPPDLSQHHPVYCTTADLSQFRPQMERTQAFLM